MGLGKLVLHVLKKMSECGLLINEYVIYIVTELMLDILSGPLSSV